PAASSAVHSSLSFDLTVTSLFVPLLAGGRVELVEEEAAAEGLAARLRAGGRYALLKLTPAHLRAVGALLEGAPDAGGAECLVVGGEPLRGEHLEPWARRLPDAVVVNEYGPTETVVGCCIHVQPLRETGPGELPIGRPAANTRLYVLDAALHPLPVGMPGELYVGGAQVTRGYLGRPALTAERFVPDPFAAHPGARLYRTGDQARWRADGSLEYLGRLDGQVKVRGFRVETGEVEAALRRGAGVADCAVVPRGDASGETRLAAYVVGQVDAEALRAHLRRTLPEHMVPADVVLLERLPLTPNGKLDRAALPAPEPAPAQVPYVAPRTPVEEALAEIWAQVLGRERVGVEENFFALGGDSILSIQVATRARRAGIRVSPRQMFDHPTIAALAPLTGVVAPAKGRAEAAAPAPAAAPPRPVRSFPLTPAQRQVWVHAQLGDDASRAYNQQFVTGRRGRLDPAVLRAAVQDLVAHHEALRTVFDPSGEVQHVLPSLPGPVPVVVHDAGGDADGLAAAMDEAVRGVFDLRTGPLFRVHLHPRGAERQVLQLVIHHVVADGLAIDLLARDLDAACRARAEGRAPRLAPAMQPAEYARLLAEHAARHAEHEAAWLARFVGAVPLVLPYDRPRTAFPTHRAGTAALVLPPPLVSRLREVGRRQGCTLFMTLLGGLLATLHRTAGQDDVVVGISSAGRPFPGSESLVAHCVDVLPVRSRIGQDTAVRAFFRDVRGWLLEAYEHEVFSYARLSQALPLAREPGLPPLVSVVLNLEPGGKGAAEGGAPAFGGVEVEVEGITGADAPFTKFDLHIDVLDGGDAVEMICLYNAGLFDRGTVERMLEHVQRVLEQAAGADDVLLSELELVGAAERSLLLDEWNRTDAGYPSDHCIHHLFEAQAERTPEAIALSFDDQSLTYGELNARANRLAHHLARRGVGPEVRVGLCLERGVEMVVAILGVLKAGGAYVPLDPAYPAERIAFTLQDAGVPILLTQDALRGILPAQEGIDVISLDGARPQIAAESAENPESGATPDTLAYVIYTSGSTGTPKGALIEHRNVARLFSATDAWFGFGAEDVWTLFHSYAFDFSVWEMWGALLYGGRLVVVPLDVSRDPETFHALLQREGVTVLNQTPSAFRQLIRADAERGGELALRLVVFGGEALEPASLREWVNRRGAERPKLVNMYGITETTVHVTYRPLSADDVLAGAGSPIGRRIPDLKLYVLDGARRPVLVGVPGELYVGGAGVARGYLNRPELTAERFIDNPFGTGRLYRTGDRVRWLADGTLEYGGRLDGQVKIRGFRIEPGEVEAALLAADSVRECAVVVREDEPGDRRLVAYVVGRTDADALWAQLRGTLPEHMVPSAFVPLDRLPLTPNGKLDRAALPAPEHGPAEDRYAAPRTDVETALAAIWAEVLRVDRVGVDDSFFRLGGDSILCIQVVTRARRVGIDLSPRQVFEHQTIARLAEVVGRPAEAPRSPTAPVDGAVPLTPIQSWFVEQGHPVPAHYNQSLLLDVDAALGDAALEAALAAVVRHHDALRLRFRRTDAGWEQWHAPEAGIALERVDLAGLAADARARAQARAMDARQASLDLERGPLGRAVLFDRGGAGRQLLIVLHHLVVDTVSWTIVRDDLERACGQAESGEPIDLGAKSTPFGEWAEALRAYAAGDALRAQAAHWLAQGAEGVAPLPVDGTGEAQADACTLEVRLDAEETRALLREVPAAYRTQVNDVLLCALAEAVSGWTGSPRVRLALEGHGREEEVAPGADLTRTVGWFTSIYPVVLDAGEGGGPGDRLKRVKEQLRAVPARGIGYGVLRYLGTDAELRRALAAQAEPEISFNYLGQLDGGPEADTRLRVSGDGRGREWARENRNRYPLAINGGIVDGCLALWWTYGEETHRRETIERLAGAYVQALRGLIAHCRQAGAGGCTPSDFPLAGLTQAELDTALRGVEGVVEDLYPLSPMQEGMLFHAVYSGEDQEYQTQAAQRLEGPLDVELFRYAWAQAARRYSALRTSFVWEGLPRHLQRVQAEVEIPWRVEDWRHLPPDAQEAALQRYLDEDRVTGFVLQRAPLVRLALFRVADDAHWFVWNQHHLLMDGWSCARLAAEVFGTYAGWRTGAAVQPGRVRPYRDYIAWLQRQDAQGAERYWRRTLAGFTAPTPLGVDRPAAAAGVVRHARLTAAVSAHLTGRLQEVARGSRVTLNTVLLGAWGLLLSRYGGEEDVVLGTTVSGRQAGLEGVEEMVGLFINTLPVRMRVDGAARMDDWLGELQRAQAGAREFEYASLPQVQGWSEVPRGTPLFESHFIFENYPLERAVESGSGDGGGSATGLRVTDGRGLEWNNFPLSLLAAPGPELALILSYDENRFDRGTAERMLGHLGRVLEQVAADPRIRLAEVELSGADERRRVVEEWNRTDAAYPADRCIHQLFQEQAARTPDAAAVVFGGASLSYRELDARANRIAHHLVGLGVGPEVRVGLCLERGLDLLPALLGVIKAGGAYVPVDPAHPAERIGYVLADSAAAVLLTQASLRDSIPVRAEVQVVCVDTERERIAGESAEVPVTAVTAENLAYVIYTSGSTGRPKGVAMHHRGVCNYIDWGVRAYGADQGSGAPVFSSMAVDLTITNL
ncbi:MAG TPA: amino acid adenylation domain-containing protein, partial [Longimicrobium sp.]|nr:amino acid adenylation domain-containing protein [Longimicrobium sp.]